MNGAQCDIMRIALAKVIESMSDMSPDLRVRVLSSAVVFFGCEAAVSKAVVNAIDQKDTLTERVQRMRGKSGK